MEEVTLVADVSRPVGKSAARKIRRDGKVPAIVYGLGTDPEPVAVPSRELQHILAGAGGANTLIKPDLSGREDLVLARPGGRPPGGPTPLHLDLLRGAPRPAPSA